MIYPEKYNSASRFLFLEHSQEINMTQDQKLKYLSVALRIFGIIFIVGIYAMMMWIWPAGWGWEPRQPEYEQMIMGIYATLGVFLILAARNPMAHLSLIWFNIWSSFVHCSGCCGRKRASQPSRRYSSVISGRNCAVGFGTQEA
jgi:sterol desaturase/sphingolipid hydroxylase (fatty acid hydroxylase superfamily)